MATKDVGTTATQSSSVSLAEALAAAQADMPAVEPNAVNPHFRSKFVSLDHLIAKTRGVLNRHGLSLTQWPSITDGQPTLTTRITHTSGEFLDSTMPLLLQKNDMQGLGGAITYARRYAWSAALGIAADEDDDGNQASAAANNGAAANGATAVEPKASAAAVKEIEKLIGLLNETGALGEVEIRDGMDTAYGTHVTAELTVAQAENLKTRLAAKAAEGVPA